MKSNYLKHLFTALFLLCATVAAAHDFEVGGIYYNILSQEDKTVAVTDRGTYHSQYSNEYTGSVVIPEIVTYNGNTYSVASVSASAFRDCTVLTSIEIPNSVTTIENFAFEGCIGLTSIEIPNSVTSIGTGAFEGCIGLTSIEIPNSVTNLLQHVFKDCSGLTSIEIPNSVVSIGYEAFYGCTSLTGVVIPNSVTSFSKNVFRDCTSLTNIFIAEGNTKYDSREGCNAVIETVTNTLILGCKNSVIPNNVTSIGNDAFEYCSGLTSIEIPSSVTSIGDYAFRYCSGLTSIEVPNSVVSIGIYAFYGCTSLTGVVIPNSVTRIGSSAFEDCKSLTGIEIPNSVKSLGTYVFNGCASLASLVVAEGNTVYDSRNNCNAIIVTSTNTLVYGCKNTIIPNSVTSIGGDAFYNCSGLTSVTIPNSVTSIGGDAFCGCTSLTGVVIPNSVTRIGNGVLNGCSGLTSITSLIPADALFAVGEYVFVGVDKSACTLYVPAGAKNKYASTDGWKDFVNIVELESTEVEPTEVTITIGQYGSTVYSSPYALDFSDVEGLKAYAATGYKTNSQIITLTRVQTAEAGIGVLLKGEPGEYIVPVIESTDEHSLNMLVATLEKTTVNGTSSDGLYANFKYTIKSGDATPLFYRFADGSSLSAGKAYLQIPFAWLPSTASNAISIRFDEGEATDMDEVYDEAEGENGKLVYDLQGRAVENPTNGIYIIDGKKVLVK